MTTIKYPDPATGQWKTVGGNPPDAPSDGKIYGRRNGAWVEVTSSGGLIAGGFISIGPTVDFAVVPLPITISTGFTQVNYV